MTRDGKTTVIEVVDRKRYGETTFRAMGYGGLRLYVMVFTLLARARYWH